MCGTHYHLGGGYRVEWLTLLFCVFTCLLELVVTSDSRLGISTELLMAVRQMLVSQSVRGLLERIPGWAGIGRVRSSVVFSEPGCGRPRPPNRAPCWLETVLGAPTRVRTSTPRDPARRPLSPTLRRKAAGYCYGPEARTCEFIIKENPARKKGGRNAGL